MRSGRQKLDWLIELACSGLNFDEAGCKAARLTHRLSSAGCKSQARKEIQYLRCTAMKQSFGHIFCTNFSA